MKLTESELTLILEILFEYDRKLVYDTLRRELSALKESEAAGRIYPDGVRRKKILSRIFNKINGVKS